MKILKEIHEKPNNCKFLCLFNSKYKKKTLFQLFSCSSDWDLVLA